MFDDLLAANDRYIEEFSFGGLTGRAAKGLALVTCVDTRIEPLSVLGLRPGDAKILRNAGGRVTPDALRSLVLVVCYLGVTRVAVMHHTDCALARLDEAEIRATLGPERSAAAPWNFLTLGDPDAALDDDVDAVADCAALPAGIVVAGWRYHVETGAIEQVVPARVSGGDRSHSPDQ